MKKILVGLCIAVVLYVGFIQILALQHAKDMSVARKLIDTFFLAYNEQHYADVYNKMLTDRTKGLTNITQIESVMANLHKNLGILRSKEMEAWKALPGRGEILYAVRYKITHEKANSIVVFYLQKQRNKSWLIEHFDWN